PHTLALASLFAVVLVPSLRAQQDAGAPPASRRITVADHLEWEDVGDPQLSPDGRQVAFTRRSVDKVNDKWDTAIWVMNADGSRQRSVVTGTAPRWSPDGSKLLYIATGQPAGMQLWVRYMDGDAGATQLTRLTEAPTEPEWSPDGRMVAFRMNVPTRETWNIALPATPKGAKWTDAPRIVQRLNYRSDRVGFTDDGYQHLFVMSADGGQARQVTTGNWNHSAARWTPDSRSLLFSGLRTPDAEGSWRESEIYRADVAAGTITALTSHKGPDNNPIASPDGKLIAYTGYDSTDATWKDANIWLMNADGSNARAINVALDRAPQGVMWAPDGSGVYYNVENEGYRNLYFTSVTGQTRAITTGKQVLSVTDVDKAGNMVGIMSSELQPNDVVRLNLRAPGTITRLTRINDDVLAGKQLGRTEEIWLTSVDGFRIQGWIVKPADFDASKKYPLMLEIHGGPHAMYNGGFSLARQDHVANGYVLLYTNPRGSTGYGSAFGNAIKNAYPGKDYDDLMASVDTVVNRGYVDTKRMYVFGCSGGGVLTSWIVGHTTRFAAASANCPVIDWLSFVGTTDGAGWYRNFAQLPWVDPSEHLRRSPLMYVGNVKTPTMLMTGVQDLRTPMPQTEEFYSALKMMKVPTAMIRFNEEWHGTSSKPSNWMRTQLYMRSWFDKWPAPVTTSSRTVDGAR
ncbi:MAG TPA: S9 family peptidase, partial [Gemmatimonadaceae bacterium]|nr:S9 family peptidase [Gemmatimonadaceae bacterium]